MLAFARQRAVLEALLISEPPHFDNVPDLGVYVHVPFCERVCPYCDFAVEGVGRVEAETERAYLERVLRELGLHREESGEALGSRRIATLYLGGGTPSLLSAEGVARLIEGVRAAFPGEPQEVTLELNPGTAECARVPGYRAAGVTRLSVGLQSLHDGTLRRLGRAHDSGDALRGLEACLAAGFPSLSVDLIFGAPGQREAELLADVEHVLALGVPHVSAYALTVEPGTPFSRAQARGRLRLPSEAAALRMGQALRARLAAGGLEQYEISSYARPGHRSRHNQRYWLREDVLGLGVSAASLLGARRFRNERSRARWERRIDLGELPLEECEELPADTVRRETLWLGLRRLEGVSRATWLRRFGAPPERWFGAGLEELRGLGLLCEAEGHLRLTERGVLFADEVFVRLGE